MSKKIVPQIVLAIGGTDPTSGAGIQADIKTISALGCYAANIITALVAQNTVGVQRIEKVSPDFIANQFESVFNDLKIKAVKIGMLNNLETITAVSSSLQKFKPKNIVLDPVITAKSGHHLLSPDAMAALVKLFSKVKLITPNLFEVECLLQNKIRSLDDVKPAAKQLAEIYKVNVLLKGGHFNFKNNQASDFVYLYKEKKSKWFHAKKISTRNTHGTGCTLSSAIATYLAQNYSLLDSIKLAKLYVSKAIYAGSKIKIGVGNGPLDHFHFLRNSFQ